MRCRTHADLAQYAGRVIPWLVRDPIVNNVICTLLEARTKGLAPIEPDGLWLRVEDAAGNGTNGSGKSSLLGAIAGSLGHARGRVFLDGREVTDWAEPRRARLIGRVFQNPFTGTASDLSVAENLTLAARRGGQRWLRQALGTDRRQAIREQVIRLGMGLEDRLDTPIGLLSGGQRQALTVLMATMLRPSLLLLDEHTAALDPRSAELVIRLTREVIANGGLTTLMVTHSLPQAVRLGDRVLVMHRGRLVYDIAEFRRQRLAEDDLLQLFDQLRWADRLDESAAEMLRRAYV